MVFPFKNGSAAPSSKQLGDAGEARALAHLERAGLRLLARNYRTPGRGGGEIDLIMQTPDGTCVFVEVRQRKSSTHGGAAATIGATKQARLKLAARHYLMRQASLPPCRFDVIAIDGDQVSWMQAAFDAE